MNANAVAILAIFEKKVRLEVPLFQRSYVWNKEHQWGPLWDDLARKFTDQLDGRTDAPVHFLGAMVLDQKATPTVHVERRQIIDGQQRLTTLQLFLAAFRDFCREQECEDIAIECQTFTFNTGMMANQAVDKFKVWPTQADRDQFQKVLVAGSRVGVEKAFPLTKKKYSNHFNPRPRMAEAYLFFYDNIKAFFLGNNEDAPIGAATPLPERLVSAFTALQNNLRVVVIDLDNDDDAQVIFETLNARGEPLIPADLLRNYIFLRASREGADQEALYAEYWKPFDEAFWRQEVRQGRLSRPRSDLFIQHFLASKQTFDIPIKHLYVEYKYWIERQRPFTSINEELSTIARQGADYRRLVEHKTGDPVGSIAIFLEAFDISTAYPLLLHLLDNQPTDEEWASYTGMLESYLLRRAVCGMTTKNYNKTFLTIIKNLRRDGTTPAALQKALLAMTNDSGVWPIDDDFTNMWLTSHAYETMSNSKLVYILRQLNQTYLTNMHEDLNINNPLSIEHLLPQRWIDHWPLTDGTRGLTLQELYMTLPNAPHAVLTKIRNAALQTMGNLTVLTMPLNSSVSNGPWKDKRLAILANSLLPINQALHQYEIWNEEMIEQRGRELLNRAIKRWPRPEALAQNA